MDSRLNLQTLLEGVLGSTNVYFQPPPNNDMKYPAIVYERYKIVNNFANNLVYNQQTSYMVTVIDEDPDSEIVVNVSKLPSCLFDRHFISDNLNHDVYILYY